MIKLSIVHCDAGHHRTRVANVTPVSKQIVFKIRKVNNQVAQNLFHNDSCTNILKLNYNYKYSQCRVNILRLTLFSEFLNVENDSKLTIELGKLFHALHTLLLKKFCDD